MNYKITTEKSLNNIKYKFIPLVTLLFLSGGILKWYKNGGTYIVFESACYGFLFASLVWLILYLRYKNVEYEISSESIVEKKGKGIKQNIKISDIEYYYFSEQSSCPILKLKGFRKFYFAMIDDSENILTALSEIGIDQKPDIKRRRPFTGKKERVENIISFICVFVFSIIIIILDNYYKFMSFFGGFDIVVLYVSIPIVYAFSYVIVRAIRKRWQS